MEAPPFPTSEAELAPWHVYADHLLARGEGLGELLAHELSLPLEPDPAGVARLHDLARRWCRRSEKAPVGWCLGQLRTLQLRGASHMIGDAFASVEPGALANARDLVASARGARLQHLAAVVDGEHAAARAWRRMMAALPVSCARFTWLFRGRQSDAEAQAVAASLPAGVRELAVVGQPWQVVLPLVDDRFDVVDARSLGFGGAMAPWGEVAAALARTQRVRLRVGWVVDAPPLAETSRLIFGGADDAALVDGRARRVQLLRGTGLIALQRHFGVVAVRAQMTRALPETWRFGHGGGGSVRRQRGRWTLQTYDGEAPGRATPADGTPRRDGEIVAVAAGAPLRIDGEVWRLVDGDVDAGVRAELM